IEQGATCSPLRVNPDHTEQGTSRSPRHPLRAWQAPDLEDQPRSELNDARIARRRNHAEGRALVSPIRSRRKGLPRVSIIGVVEDVEHLRPELHLQLLEDLGVL